MLAIEFTLKISSMYSIRVPYSYQCARTYPLPAPSTIKGLCTNALWRMENKESPVEILETIHKNSLGATSRAGKNIAVSSCTVSIVDLSKKEGKKTNALLRQFAFTPYIDCMVVLKDNTLAERIKDALKSAPVYLGDSESLVSIIPKSINSTSRIEEVTEGQTVTVNTLFKFDFIRDNQVNEKGVVLYMQDDPCADDAVLERYMAPLKQDGDLYKPLDSISFVSAKKGFIAIGKRLQGILCEEKQTETAFQKPSRIRKKKQG